MLPYSNHPRTLRLIRESIDFFELDLSGLVILTEAASGPFVTTPIIAALAGAHQVLALTSDSSYASAEEVILQTRSLEHYCKIAKGIEISTDRALVLFSRADIITNLGFVRPIDASVVEVLKPTAVISLMCEEWEYRSSDVDQKACKEKGIVVAGINEDYSGMAVFNYCGWLCLKMLFEAQIEVYKSRILVVSSDKMGRAIFEQLKNIGIQVRLVKNLNVPVEELVNTDAIVVADYTRTDNIIGFEGDISPEIMKQIAPGITIIQFSGKIEFENLQRQGISVYPGIQLDPRRMAKTLAYLGVRPVIELHTAGLKVGELLVRKSYLSSYSDLIQLI
jgi:hypothetical protein